MRVRYVVGLKEPVLLEDHWPIPLMDGEMRVIADGKTATALEIVFTGQPTAYAPSIEHDPKARIATTITGRDLLLPFVMMKLETAFTYLQCYFDIELQTDEIKIEYTPETNEERSKIEVTSMSRGKVDQPHSLPFDLLTRATMVAESGAPSFEATLVGAARKAALQKKFIDSFRYSFLLIESLYGEGKFKSAQVKDALKGNLEFTAMVAAALNQRIQLKKSRGSATEKLLSTSPNADALIDHLVEMRGYYFHGNVKRADAWRPQDQAKAEALCMLALDIAMAISHAAAAPMFADEFSKCHFDYAKRCGAIMSMKVNFRYRARHETFDRNRSLKMNVPGTIITPKMAQYVAQQFLATFEHDTPDAALKSASCTADAIGQKVFDIEFHIPGAESNS
jgi:hypothetical protein